VNLSGRPTKWASAEQVDVQVEDRLSGARPDVQDCAISSFDIALASNHGRGKMTAADDFGVCAFCFFQSGKMALRNYQYVGWGLGMDVIKGEDMFVLVNLF
jgi:hypothetical protein